LLGHHRLQGDRVKRQPPLAVRIAEKARLSEAELRINEEVAATGSGGFEVTANGTRGNLC